MNSFRNKAVAAALAVTTVAWMLPVAGAQTTADLQAQIQDLLAKIAVLQAQLGTVRAELLLLVIPATSLWVQLETT